MLRKELIDPESIVVVGGSNNIRKPGGKVLHNIITGGYKGKLYVVNYREDVVQGIKCHHYTEELPEVDLAILAIPANYCKDTVRVLAEKKNTKGFIIITAGFSERTKEGAQLEKEIAEIATAHDANLIGPNCMGVLTPTYNGIFTSPVPKLNPMGCDFVSGSGGTAIFILESALPKGLTFSSLFSVGNSTQIGIEDVLQHWDETFDPEKSSKIKIIYVENIKDPDKLLKHASSLIRKGCKIAAIKSGVTEAGKRATSSHTGAIASSDSAVEALFRKAGIVRCFGREELATVASVFMYKELKGNNLAIITHAGGPGVMLTDALAAGGLNIPRFEGEHYNNLLSMLDPGASALNPIDLIASGTAEQLGQIIEYCDNCMDDIHGMIVIFGSTGLTPLYDVYETIHEQVQQCSKPVFPILPSISSAKEEVDFFLAKGHINFPDEVVLGRALTLIYNTPYPAEEKILLDGVDIPRVREIIESCKTGFQDPDVIQKLLESASIPIVTGGIAKSKKELLRIASKIGFPLAIKVIGPVHKSDIGGVTLNIKSDTHLLAEYNRMMKIKGVKAVLVQKMQTGTELFIGAKYEPTFGHVILCGLGGIFVEVFGDHSSGLAPLTFNEAYSMIRNLKSYAIIQGIRGQEGVNEDKFAEIIVRLSSLLRFAVEIKELDLNPLIGNKDEIIVVDSRVLIEK
ncbi:MAG TPA: acetate--CoA ligase family protein [Bacteroidales bacterium]|nr:acetate--CoA ligase family protein [Bacteroidales bacterium]